MDESAIDRAKERVEQRADAEAVNGVLERTRAQLEALAAAAQETAESLPERVQEGLREQVVPVGRNLAEIRGLMNQVIRRLENLEADTLADRHARVDDLALLVDLISSGWKSVDARLGRIESLVTRLEEGLQERGGAIVYRIEDRRPDAANNG
jgi:two-component sensor histidine kinase